MGNTRDDDEHSVSVFVKKRSPQKTPSHYSFQNTIEKRWIEAKIEFLVYRLHFYLISLNCWPSTLALFALLYYYCYYNIPIGFGMRLCKQSARSIWFGINWHWLFFVPWHSFYFKVLFTDTKRTHPIPSMIREAFHIVIWFIKIKFVEKGFDSINSKKMFQLFSDLSLL